MVLTSRFSSRPIPEVSLAPFFREAVAMRADEIAVLDGPTGNSYTFRQLLDRSASVANGLIARGVAPGDRVAFVCPNLPEVAIAYHGVIAAGAVAMMVNPLSTAEELAKYFERRLAQTGSRGRSTGQDDSRRRSRSSGDRDR
jgi:4-coumarate--CoA ligase